MEFSNDKVAISANNPDLGEAVERGVTPLMGPNPRGCVPGCGGNSILRSPCLKYFFHNWLITNDLKTAKA